MMACYVEECDRDVFYPSAGLCKLHYDRKWRTGRFDVSNKQANAPVTWKWMLHYAKTNKNTGCIEWKKYCNVHGYGQVSTVKGQFMPAHRKAWELNFGEIPEGMEVCHSCDNPPCINPKHLFLGTHKQNMQDCQSKDRHSPGERNGYAKLKNCDVLLIRSLIAKKAMSQIRIAEIFGIGQSQVSRIKHRKRWMHI